MSTPEPRIPLATRRINASAVHSQHEEIPLPSDTLMAAMHDALIGKWEDKFVLNLELPEQQ
jgi:hypothetical protein